MKKFIRVVRVIVPLFFTVVSGHQLSAQIALHPDGYFRDKGFRFLVYQNTYLGGRLGGLEMILNGKRLLDAGNVVIISSKGKKYGYYDDSNDRRGTLVVDTKNKVATLPVELTPLKFRYEMAVGEDEGAITVTIRLEESVDWDSLESISFRLELYPEEYDYKTYQGGGTNDKFLESPLGREVLIAAAERITVAAEDPERKIIFEGENAVLSLHDNRRDLNVSGYMIFASLKKGSKERTFSMKITPSILPDWDKKPVIQVSQVGYHPVQQKIAFLEVTPWTKDVANLEIFKLNETSVLEKVKELNPTKWGDLYQNTYYTFNFSEIRDEGQYFLSYKGERTGPIKISTAVYQQAWHPTMDAYFPTQMCHVKVTDFLRLWHGPCHVDDGLQAREGGGKDGYRQGPETQTPFKPLERVPGIDWGGWHDAGDFDLPTGSICQTLLWMGLAQEQFQTTRDVTSVSRAERLVKMYQPDGEVDMLQQVSFGIEWLLSLVRQTGHVPSGVISHIGPDYGSNGDPGAITDGLPYDGSLGKTERSMGASGKFDDRWLYTGRNTGGQYQFVQTAALCARVLKSTRAPLAEECLRWAEKIWQFEQENVPVSYGSAYNPQENKYHSLEMAATAELFLATGDRKYRTKLLEFTAVIDSMPVPVFAETGFNLVRVNEAIEDKKFSRTLLKKATELREALQAELDKTPYQVQMHLGWGSNWSILKNAGKLFFFIEAYEDLYEPELLFSSVNFVLGAHMASNHSFVSGVGSKSATLVYGFNRADKSYQPGGVISGVTLINPDFVEYRGRAWDWYQTEHVISGSAAYVFDVLAADYLLNKNGR